tara:strand:- start:936 stop:1361 length:426 start_codon:yes stop_codon:yes gene_type:complete
MDEQERNDLLKMLQEMAGTLDANDTLDGQIAIQECGTICIEGQDSLGNCAALRIVVADDDNSYDVTLEGGFREGTRFECRLFLGNIKDVVEAAVVVSQAAWDHCGLDKELVKGAIRQEWREPSDVRVFIMEQLIAHSAEMD